MQRSKKANFEVDEARRAGVVCEDAIKTAVERF